MQEERAERWAGPSYVGRLGQEVWILSQVGWESLEGFLKECSVDAMFKRGGGLEGIGS